MATLDDTLLDEADRMAEVDRAALLRAVATGGAQVRESVALTAEAGVEGFLAGQRPRAVLVAADPVTSDVAGTVLALCGGPDATAPVLAHTDPALPTWAGPLDLVLAACFGTAPERVTALVEAATRRGVPVVATGPDESALAEICGRSRLPFVGLPSGRLPRAAYWSLLVPLLRAAASVGLLRLDDADLAAAADTLDAVAERCRPASDTFMNPAKSLALDLAGSYPVLWGTSPLAGAAAYRFAGQLAGAGRVPALSGALPAAGYRYGGALDGDPTESDDLFRDRLTEAEPRRARLVAIRDVDEAPDVHLMIERALADLRGRGGLTSELVAEEGGPLTRLASLVGVADFTAVYAGLAQGVDPSGARTGDTPT